MTFKSIASVLPKIYCYSTPGVTYHEGWVKIGYTEQDDVVKRLEQQTKTAGINFKMEWTDYAIYKQDPDHQTFTDDDFKAFLEEKGIRHENNFGGDGRSIGDEWYEISPEKAQEYFNEFVQKPSMIKKLGYHLRTEQKDAVTATTDAMQSGKDTEYLWNAKPRFGKCLSAYDFIKQIHAEKVLIVTNRPAVVTSWYDDYAKFLGRESGYFFVSHVPSVKDKDLVIDYPEYEKDAARRKEEGYPPVKMIYFASLQDIKQSRFFGGDYIKLKELTTIEFDVLIIDESHEGVDTYRTDGALNRIRRKFTLYLSGTPFKAIQDEKFDAESIYNWTYVSEQEAKENWDGNGTNPYFQMPRLNMMTYRLSGIIGEEKPDLNDEEESTAEDRLNEFFKTNTSGFVHDAEVDKFLDTISGDEKYPFGSETQRGQLAHTFWLLSRVESAKALEEKLKKHPVFSRYAIVNVAGNNNDHAYEDVITAIAENPMTITLSVGRLTTGVTIPQWSAVMMLSERNSPAEYMQASFRAQNPYIFCRENKMTGRFEHFRKTDAYVFDFNPEHTLDIVEKFANNLYSSTANGRGDVDERRHNITQLLQYMPVTGEADDGRMEPLDADKVMLIPRKMRSQEVVRRGFMCDMLFQNVTNVFHITGNDIISKLLSLMGMSRNLLPYPSLRKNWMRCI